MSLVIDAQRFRQTRDLASSLVPASLFVKSPSDIVKKFFPPNIAKAQIKAPMVTQRAYLNFTGASAPSLPKSFDWRSSGKIVSPQNQGECGSCWAVSSATCIADRWAVARKTKAILLSPMSITNCTPNEDCNTGGFPSDAMQVAATLGIESEKCAPYSCNCQMLQGGPAGVCTDTSCGPRWFTNPASIRAAVVLKGGVTTPTSVDDIDVDATIRLIQTSIMTDGPVVTGFSVPSDFMALSSSSSDYIYRANSNDSVGWHAVCLVGWGTDSQGQLYWILRNSWGTGFANGGYVNVYAYPLNNVGFDIPLFMSSSSGTISRAHAATSVQLGRRSLDFAAAQGTAFGGVTIASIDLARSPPQSEQSVILKLATPLYGISAKNRNWLIGGMAGVVVILVVYWMWKRRQV